MNFVKIDLRSNMSDQEIRELALLWPNGDYVYWVCKKCGCYATSPTHSTENAIIREDCDDCFDVEKGSSKI